MGIVVKVIMFLYVMHVIYNIWEVNVIVFLYYIDKVDTIHGK
jgi:hypothetical protein